MPANVESMFYVRQVPWHGLGKNVEIAPTSADALVYAGLNWKVSQRRIQTEYGLPISGYKANVRSSDGSILGIVSDRYSVVQNDEAFAFTDELLGEGVRYETAGSLNGGRKVWLLAKMPQELRMLDDEFTPYLVFTNTHDGSGCIKVAMTPVRVVCQNTLNLALSSAKRSWSARHVGNIDGKLVDARKTLQLAERYMTKLSSEFENLEKTKLSYSTIDKLVDELLPLPEEANLTATRSKNNAAMREQLMMRYYDAPDLQNVGQNAYRFINAVSDFATHAEPLRRTRNYNENLFEKLIDGHPMIDKAFDLLRKVV